jgi:hypothetical protein
MFGEGRVDAAAPHFDLGKLALAHARANEADTDGEVVAKRLRWLTGGPPHTLCVPLAVARARAAGAPRKVIRLTIGEEGRPGVAAAHLCAWVELMTALAEMPGDDGERLEFIVPQDGGDVCGPRLALRRAWPHVLAALEALVAPDSARHYCDIVLRNMAVSSALEEDEESEDSGHTLADDPLERSRRSAVREARGQAGRGAFALAADDDAPIAAAPRRARGGAARDAVRGRRPHRARRLLLAVHYDLQLSIYDRRCGREVAHCAAAQ